MKAIVICLLGLVFLVTISKAQYYYYNAAYFDPEQLLEFGFSAGSIQGFTDISNRNEQHPLLKYLPAANPIRPSLGLSLQLLKKYKWGLRLEWQTGEIAAADSLDTRSSPLGNPRNLSFKTSIHEISLVAICNFEGSLQRDHPIRPSTFLMAGIGLFGFNPQAKLAQHWVSLHPLHTEGQGFPENTHSKPYRLIQVNLPVGIGLRYEQSALISFTIELLYRFLFTDYLDDISSSYANPEWFDKYLSPALAARAKQLHNRGGPVFNATPGRRRGNPSKKDSYLSLTLGGKLALNRKKRH